MNSGLSGSQDLKRVQEAITFPSRDIQLHNSSLVVISGDCHTLRAKLRRIP